GGPGHDQVHRQPGAEEGPDHRLRVGRAGRPGHPDDPRPPGRREVRHRSPWSSTRSATAKPNSASPITPFAVKNARLTRDRSSGRPTRCSSPSTAAVNTTPAYHNQPYPVSAPKAAYSPVVPRWISAEARSAAGTPNRTGTDRTPIRRSTSASWQE